MSQAWEYRMVPISPKRDEEPRWRASISDLGLQGWEICGIVPERDVYEEQPCGIWIPQIILKRPLDAAEVHVRRTRNSHRTSEAAV